jgi:hypothetical protein
MNFEQAIAKIVKNWEELKDKEKENLGYSSRPQMVAVWCGKSDTADGYDVDEEWIGVTPSGKIAWAYASGCSCWEGDFSEQRFVSLKEVTLNHTQNTPKEFSERAENAYKQFEDWENAIIQFAETGVIQNLK